MISMADPITRKSNDSYQLWYTPAGDTGRSCLSFFQTPESRPFLIVHLYEEIGVLVNYATKRLWDQEAALAKQGDEYFKANRNKLMDYVEGLDAILGRGGAAYADLRKYYPRTTGELFDAIKELLDEIVKKLYSLSSYISKRLLAIESPSQSQLRSVASSPRNRTITNDSNESASSDNPDDAFASPQASSAQVLNTAKYTYLVKQEEELMLRHRLAWADGDLRNDES